MTAIDRRLQRAVIGQKLPVVAALAPLCVERFQHATEASANLAALKKADSYSQGDYVAKGGWATMTASSPPDQVSDVARACATLLTGG